MDLAILSALITGQMAQIAGQRLDEIAARDVISGLGISQMIGELFPNVDSALLGANADVVNHLQEGASRYTRAMTRGSINWEWEAEGDPPEAQPSHWLVAEIVQQLTTDALVSGKVALFPRVDEQGRLRVNVLGGYLHPVRSEGELVALLQVLPIRKEGKILYQVRRYSAGLLEVFDNLEDWQKFNTAPAQQYPQSHCPDRLPVAFGVSASDAYGEPLGLVRSALPAFRRYVKAAVLLSFIAHRGGFEERVIKSDQVFQLAKSEPRNALLGEIKKVGPNSLRVLDAGGSYERLDPVALAEYREQERDAKADARAALLMPDTDGANLSGEALAEKREAYTETCQSLAGLIADALTECHELLAKLRPAEVRSGWRITLTPRFARDVTAERVALREDYKAGLPKSAWLSGLQSLGVEWVTDQHVEDAQNEEAITRAPEAGT